LIFHWLNRLVSIFHYFHKITFSGTTIAPTLFYQMLHTKFTPTRCYFSHQGLYHKRSEKHHAHVLYYISKSKPSPNLWGRAYWICDQTSLIIWYRYTTCHARAGSAIILNQGYLAGVVSVNQTNSEYYIITPEGQYYIEMFYVLFGYVIF
jgi:hypothetical protein